MCSIIAYLKLQRKKSMNKQLCLTLFLLACFSISSIAAAEVAISAVPSANNPPVGYQIEVSINIADGSNVAGYDFRLTFNSTVLELIDIENSDYLPGEPFSMAEDYRSDGTYVPEIEHGDGSVRFAAVTLTGIAEGDGTLAVATFKVLAETETPVGLEDVVIGNRTAQEIDVVSVKGATITPIAAGADLEYLLLIPRGMSLIHVPLKVTAVDGVAKTISTTHSAVGQTSISSSPMKSKPKNGAAMLSHSTKVVPRT